MNMNYSFNDVEESFTESKVSGILYKILSINCEMRALNRGWMGTSSFCSAGGSERSDPFIEQNRMELVFPFGKPPTPTSQR